MSWNRLPERGLELCGDKNATLKINQACLDVVSFISEPVHLFTRNVECYKVRKLSYSARFFLFDTWDLFAISVKFSIT